MKKHYSYIVAGILILVALILVLNKKDASLKITSADLRTGNPALITGLSITNLSGTIELKKENKTWMANDIHEVRPGLIMQALSVFNHIEILGVAAKELQDSLFTSQKFFGTTIRFIKYNKATEYKIINYEGVNYLKTEKSKIIYRVAIKNQQDINIEKLFPVKISVWMNNMILDLPSENIKSISVNYPDQKKSFTLERTVTGFKLYNAEMNVYKKDINEEFVRTYFSFFTDIESLPQKNKNMKEGNMIFSFAITTTGNKQIELKGYELQDKNTGIPDLNMCLLKSVSGNSYFVYYTDIDPILAEYDNFIKN
jgi:hypothetical protein